MLWCRRQGQSSMLSENTEATQHRLERRNSAHSSLTSEDLDDYDPADPSADDRSKVPPPSTPVCNLRLLALFRSPFVNTFPAPVYLCKAGNPPSFFPVQSALLEAAEAHGAMGITRTAVAFLSLLPGMW